MRKANEEAALYRLEVLRPQPVIRRGSEEITLGAKGGIALAVALYLVITREKETERAELIQIFQAMAGGGPDRDHLRGIIHDLRHTFGPDAPKGREKVRWGAPVAVDAEELLALTPETMLDDTLSLYQGDFLSGWDKLKHAGRFWSWVRERRDELRRHAFTLLDGRASGLGEGLEWERVRMIGRRMSTLWPDREEGYLWELRALEQLGRFAEAHERYADAERALREHGTAPSQPLNDLGERLLRQHQEEMYRRTGDPPSESSKLVIDPASNAPQADPSQEEKLPPAESAYSVALEAEERGTDPPPSVSRAEGENHLRTTERGPSRRWFKRSLVQTVVAAGLLALTALSISWVRGSRGNEHRPTKSDAPICTSGSGRGTLTSEVHHRGGAVDAGASFTKVWMLKNTGQCTWWEDFKVARVQDANTGNFHSIVASDTVGLGERVRPGDSTAIRILMQAPERVGTLAEQWTLLEHDGTTVRIDSGMVVSLHVRPRQPPLCNSSRMRASLVSSSHAESQLIPGGSDFQASWSIRNLDSLCAWPPTVTFKRQQGSLSGTLTVMVAGERTFPRATATLLIPMRAPTVPRSYTEVWSLFSADGRLIPVDDDPHVSLTISVPNRNARPPTAPPLCGPREAKARFVSETIRDSTEMFAGQRFRKLWTLRNAGGCRWEAPMTLRRIQVIGTAVSSVEEIPVSGTVMPERTFSFVVEAQAPEVLGSHTERWMLIDADGNQIRVPNLDHVSVSILVVPNGASN